MALVLGISGSTRTGGTSAMVQAALEGAVSVSGCRSEFIDLSGLDIRPCRDNCVECVARSACVQEDDMQAIYPRMLAADAFIVGTPVYYGSPSALCKAFMERMEGFGIMGKPLRLKVGGSIAVGGSRASGAETSLIALNLWYHLNEVLPVGITTPSGGYGVSGVGGPQPDDVEKDLVNRSRADIGIAADVSARETAWMYGRKIATIAKIMLAGREATGLDLPDPLPYGGGLPMDFPESVRHELRD